MCLLGEDIRKGQRVEEFMVEGLVDGSWQVLGKGTTIGYKRLLRFATCQPEKIRLTLKQSRAEMNIREMGVYLLLI